jgi:hypothetical protein
MTTPYVLLKRTRQLLNHPDNWTKNTFARDKDQRACFVLASQACSWCLYGALRRCNYDDYSTPAEKAEQDVVFHRAANLLNEEVGDYMEFNDAKEITHENILQLLDTVIHKVALTAVEPPA